MQFRTTRLVALRRHVVTCSIILAACWLGQMAPASAQATRSTALTVKVLARDAPNAPTYTVARAWVCVGDARDPKRYGTQQMANPTGEITFHGIPLGVEVLVTAWMEWGSATNYRGGRTTVQIPDRSFNARAEVVFEFSRGPTCLTPGLSKEAAPTRTDPFIELDKHPLKTLPGGPLIRSRELSIFNLEHAHSDPNRARLISVRNAPTEYRTSQNSSFSGASWRTMQRSDGAYRQISHQISGNDGRKTVYIQFRNSAATSPTYALEFDFLDLYECNLEYGRAHNALESNSTLGREQVRLLRAQSKMLNVAWPSPNESQPGYGMHLRWARNMGDHPIVLSVGGGVIWNEVILEPGKWKEFRADMRGVRCP